MRPILWNDPSSPPAQRAGATPTPLLAAGFEGRLVCRSFNITCSDLTGAVTGALHELVRLGGRVRSLSTTTFADSHVVRLKVDALEAGAGERMSDRILAIEGVAHCSLEHVVGA